MGKAWWNRRKEEDEFEDWQYDSGRNETSDRREIKKAAAALLLFALVYGLHDSGLAGGAIRQGVRELVTRETDFLYFAERAAYWIPRSFDAQMLERVRAVMAKPADPRQYMSAPVADPLLFGFDSSQDAGGGRVQHGIVYRSDVGTAVKASSMGRVKRVAQDEKIGRMVVLEHGREIETIYGYLSSVLVAEGDRVSQGQVIARSGAQPVSLEPALYFELREANVPVDPLRHIQGNFSSGGGQS